MTHTCLQLATLKTEFQSSVYSNLLIIPMNV